NDRCGTPERNEREQSCSGNNNARNCIAPAACSRVVGDAAHVWIRLPSRLKCSHFSSMKSSAGQARREMALGTWKNIPALLDRQVGSFIGELWDERHWQKSLEPAGAEESKGGYPQESTRLRP